MHWLRLLQQVADLEEQQQLGSRMVRHPKNTFVNIYIYKYILYTLCYNFPAVLCSLVFLGHLSAPVDQAAVCGNPGSQASEKPEKARPASAAKLPLYIILTTYQTCWFWVGGHCY